MPRQEVGEPYWRVDSIEAYQIVSAQPDAHLIVDVRRDD